MILGYDLKVCPYCNEATLSSIGETIICPKCGVIHDHAALLANILGIPANIAAKAYRAGDFGTPIDSEYVSRHNGVIINAITPNGTPQFSYPAIFPSIPESGDIYVIDRGLPVYPNSILYTGGWSQSWNPLLVRGGRKIYLLYTRESEARSIARQLKEAGGDMFLSCFCETMTIEEAITAAAPFRPIKVRETVDEEAKTLKELIDGFHWVAGGMGREPVYKRSMNSPPYQVVDAVIAWYKSKGGEFLWDEINETGYMAYDGSVYHLDKHNPMLKSLLWNDGGLLVNNGDGASILEGVCCQAFSSRKMKPERWLTCDSEKHIIKITQEPSSIIIAQNEVNVNRSESITYQKISGIKPWWVPMEYIADAKIKTAAQMMWDLVCKYFVVADVAKEISLCWLLSAFLADYSPTRPGFRISGDATTGKSTMLLLMHWLFYGDKDAKLPKINTMAGYWRAAMMHPVLPLDNTNVRDKNMGNDFRDFLDLAATGSERILGTMGGNPFETRSQIAHTLVAISGLDDFMHGDVKTRYIEIKSSSDYKSEFGHNQDKLKIIANRSYMLSGVFNAIAHEILPNIDSVINKDTIKKYRVLLGSKSRIVDYYLIMMEMAKCLGFGDVGEKWAEYIRDNSTYSDVANADTIEWWKNYKIAYHIDEMFKMNFQNLLMKEGERIYGIKGSKQQLISALAGAGKVLNRRLPWLRAMDLIDAISVDSNAWKVSGWKFKKTDDDMFEVHWGESL